MTNRRQFLQVSAAVLAGAAGVCRADVYPSRPVKILVGFAAGGNFDIVARLLAPWMAERMGQPVVIENRPGAGSNIAAEAAIRSPADGYTLLMGGAANAVNATLYDNLAFRFPGDVAPVAGVVKFPNVLAVGAAFPAKTVPELVAYAKANPGKLSQGSSGTGTTQHLAGELFKSMAGVDFLHVPYKGGSQAIAALLGGQVEVIFEPLPAAIEHIRSGRIRALGVTTATRSEVLPDLPAIAEYISGYEASGWMGICAPKGTPRDIVERLNAVINAGLADSGLRGKLTGLGALPMAGTPSDFARLMGEETEKWARVIRAGNIKAT